MTLVTIHQIETTHLKQVSSIIARGDKIALIGDNPDSCRALLAVIAGAQHPTSGHVRSMQGVRLGYLGPLHELPLHFGEAQTLYDAVLCAFSRLRVLEARLLALEAQMTHDGASPEVRAYYLRALQRFQQAGGYDFDVRIARVLDGLGFHPVQWQMPLSILSPGELWRVRLAVLLLEQPDLLIIDEPTTMLDSASAAWLAHTLRDYPGACLLTGNDQRWLTDVADTTWFLSDGRLTCPDEYHLL